MPITCLTVKAATAFCSVADLGASSLCMNAYSEDLRKKIVEALPRGMGKSEAARNFGVSLFWVKRYAKMADDWRALIPKKRPGSQPKMG